MRYTLYYQVYKDLVFQIAGLTTELTQLRVLRFLCGGPAGSVSCLACEPCIREALCPRLRCGLAPGPRPRAGRSGAVRERSCWVLGGCLLCSASVLGSSCPRRAAWGALFHRFFLWPTCFSVPLRLHLAGSPSPTVSALFAGSPWSFPPVIFVFLFWSPLSLPLALRKVKVCTEVHRCICVGAAGYVDVGIELESKY